MLRKLNSIATIIDKPIVLSSVTFTHNILYRSIRNLTYTESRTIETVIAECSIRETISSQCLLWQVTELKLVLSCKVMTSPLTYSLAQ